MIGSQKTCLIRKGNLPAPSTRRPSLADVTVPHNKNGVVGFVRSAIFFAWSGGFAMTCPIPEEVPVCRGPLAFPHMHPEKDLADLPPCSPCADRNPDMFDFSGPCLCRPATEAPDELAALPEIVPDPLSEEAGEDLIPDWPQAQSTRVRPGALLASLGFHLAVLLLMLGYALLDPPEVDFELAAGSTYLEFDMVQIAKLGGGEELAPDEMPSPERAAEEESPPEPEPEPEPAFEQLSRPEPAPEPEIAPAPELDLKVKEPPREVAKPKKAAQEKPKQAQPKPPRATGNPEAGGKAGKGPGNVLGSAHGNSAVGGGGAGGTKSSGKVGWLVARRPEPRYPEASKQGGEQGQVVIMVTVLSSGKIGSASIAKSSGHSRLDQAALSAAKGIVFKPNKGGAPSGTVTVRVPYQFKLRK